MKIFYFKVNFKNDLELPTVGIICDQRPSFHLMIGASRKVKIVICDETDKKKKQPSKINAAHSSFHLSNLKFQGTYYNIFTCLSSDAPLPYYT